MKMELNEEMVKMGDSIINIANIVIDKYEEKHKDRMEESYDDVDKKQLISQIEMGIMSRSAFVEIQRILLSEGDTALKALTELLQK